MENTFLGAAKNHCFSEFSKRRQIEFCMALRRPRVPFWVRKSKFGGPRGTPENPVFGPRGRKLRLQDDQQKHAFYCSKSIWRAPQNSKKQTQCDSRKKTRNLVRVRSRGAGALGPKRTLFGSLGGVKGLRRGPLGGPKRPSEIINISIQM